MIQGSMTWQSPSNIAITKYWGKYGRQLPRNCSISFTLENAHTVTTLEYEKKHKPSDEISLRFFFEGKENPSFGQKAHKFMASVLDEMPFLKDYVFTIRTKNTFPHSSGIASSASGMSALAGCLCELELIHNGGTYEDTSSFRQRHSYMSRLGSGSASRSVYPVMATWGEHLDISGSSNEYAVPMEDMVHKVFKDYHDDIFIVSKREKSVSSTAGHGLMEGNPYADARYQQANTHCSQLLNALKSGDVHAFGKIAEDEALTLHALMMCSSPSYVLMEPNTLALINEIRDFRKETGLPVYFTLDAGPNIHLLYPHSIENEVHEKAMRDWVKYCESETIIKDVVGRGSQKLA